MGAYARRAAGARMTVQEFLRLPEEDAYLLELVRGRVVREPRPGARHGDLTLALGAALRQHVLAHRLGKVLVETGFVLNRTEATVRGPDISFVSSGRLPSGLADSLPECAPDLAVEVLSPSNRAGEMARKVGDYLAAGCALVWVIDPRRRCVTVHQPGAPARVLGALEALDGGDIVPGFKLPLGALFAD